MSPNWCNDYLYIKGDKGQIAMFKEIIREHNTLFKKMQAKEDEKEPEECFLLKAFCPEPWNVGENWYGWRIANWGCKWDVSDPEQLEDRAEHLEYRFDTPWGPPCAAFICISRQFPKLTFEMEYSEPGMNFEGTFIVKNGNILKNDQRQMEQEVQI